MKNKAKCRLCSSIIESMHATDYVMCKCGEIAVDGGDSLLCYSKNWENFMRLDDEGNEIMVKVKESEKSKSSDSSEKPSTDIQKEANNKPCRKEILGMLREMIKTIEGLPQNAMSSPINHYDYSSLLILLLAFFSDDCISDN